MNSQRDQCAEALQSAPHAACVSERRWTGIPLEFSSDSEWMEQWTSTAKLRRLEVERIEALLANVTEPSISSRPVGNEAVEFGKMDWEGQDERFGTTSRVGTAAG
jgi:hypothetical protein